MKKILFLFILCISFTSLCGQSITGNKIVCPKQKYTYTYTLPSAATKDINISVFINYGKNSSNNSTIATYTIKKGESKFTFDIIWDDTSTPFGLIDAQASDGVTKTVNLRDIIIASIINSKPTVFSSTPSQSNGIIKIPLGSTGTLNMAVDEYLYYPYLRDNNSYKITDYKWTIGTQSAETKNKYSINYGAADLNQTTISITPIGNACIKSYGGTISYKIERYFDIKIKSNISLTCPNNNVSFSLQGIIPQGAVIEWIASDNFTLISGQGTSNAVFRAASVNAQGIARAKISYSGFSTTLENKEVWIGKPSTPTKIDGLDSSTSYKSYTEYFFYAGNIPGATGYSWSVAGNASIVSSTNQSMVRVQTSNVRNGGSFAVYLKVTNSCGEAQFGDHGTIAPSSGLGGNDMGIEKRSLALIDQPEIKSVKIYNLSGVLVYSDNAVNGSFDIKSTVLTDGVYIIEKFDGENRTSEKVMLKR